ncbi:MAG TPA: hypothetical protein VNM92_12375 [Thermoanaerobaculia bacterium]|nr:hypothetical protein [Thermoanaerobaculia bacterium]
MILWTVLSCVLFLTLLAFLTWALNKILHALQAIRSSLEKIAMGVKAISVETTPLTSAIPGVAGNLTSIGEGLVIVEKHLTGSAASLPGAARALGLLP